MIRVRFTADVPAAWNREACDELELWAHVELETHEVMLNGGKLTSSRPGSVPVALSVADMMIAGYDVAGFKRLALHEAHQSDGACSLCARRQALLVGTYCEPCTLSDGELPPQQARELAANTLGKLDELIALADPRADVVVIRRLREIRHGIEALFSDAAARDMRAPLEAEAAE